MLHLEIVVLQNALENVVENIRPKITEMSIVVDSGAAAIESYFFTYWLEILLLFTESGLSFAISLRFDLPNFIIIFTSLNY